ncbi:MAG TPA: ABC transporter permease [Bryobacteraceae bacterium]|nr:ABC transporter permease [Bryobacteraceae bacterium]
MGILEDLRYGYRSLAKSWTFAAVAVLSLGLGIGANATIFTLVNAVLLRPLPVEDPSTLAAVSTTDAHNPGLLQCSYPNYRDFRDQNNVFSSLLLYTTVTINLTGHGDPQLLMAQLVSGNYFSTLGVKPMIGRDFRAEEDATPGAYAVAIISYGLWNRQFARDPEITSRTISLNGRPFNIAGVAPPDFQGLNGMLAADVWVPVMMYQQVYPTPAWVLQRRALLFTVAGRLKPGVSLSQAEAGMSAIAKQLELQYPIDNQGRGVRLTSIAQAALAAKTRTLVTNTGGVLLVVSGLVLLIACANVANLLVAKAAGRSREITVRLALGASRWRLIRQLLTESSILALAGGSAGLLFARWARDLVWSLRPPMFAHAGLHLALDARVLTYSLAISLLTGILFGLTPAFGATRSNLATDLKERSGQAVRKPGSWDSRSVLVVLQVAFSLITLLGAGLFVRSVQNATQIDPGFDATHLGIVVFNVGDQSYSEARGREYQRRALELASSMPGVSSAALSKDVPFHVTGARTVLLDGQASGAGRYILTTAVGPGYFRTLGIPLVRGRDLTAVDNSDRPHVAIVNEAAAARFWPGEDALGKRLNFLGDRTPAEVVGIARNANYQAIGEEPQPFIYLSLLQYYVPTAVLHIRTSGDPEVVALSVRHGMQALDRNLLLQSESVSFTIRESLWAQRLCAGLLTVFGGLALLLSTIGVYGLISFSISQRVREIGVRMALGATPGEVQLLIVGEGVRLVAVGVLLGLVIAIAASHAVQSMLFVISAHDAATFVLVPSILTLVAILACWIPAWRATGIAPSVALRDE